MHQMHQKNTPNTQNAPNFVEKIEREMIEYGTSVPLPTATTIFIFIRKVFGCRIVFDIIDNGFETKGVSPTPIPTATKTTTINNNFFNFDRNAGLPATKTTITTDAATPNAINFEIKRNIDYGYCVICYKVFGIVIAPLSAALGIGFGAPLGAFIFATVNGYYC